MDAVTYTGGKTDASDLSAVRTEIKAVDGGTVTLELSAVNIPDGKSLDNETGAVSYSRSASYSDKKEALDSLAAR